MRSRPRSGESAAEVTRRRLDALVAELAASRGEVPATRPPIGLGPSDDPATAGGHRAHGPTPGRPGERSSPGRHAQRPLTRQRRLAGWIDDRLPTALQGRAHLGSAQFGMVALVLAVGLVVGAWWLVRAAGPPGGMGEVVPPRPALSSPTESPTRASAPSPAPGVAPSRLGPSAASQTRIVVDVAGKVRRPGIAVLPAGSRVVDAVRAAGGMRAGVDPATVNLARPLSDGEQVVIGLPGGTEAPVGPPLSTTASPGQGLVNLNTADQAALETLPGVGPVTAAAILEWRDQHGGFTSVDELLEVSGIGDATLAEIAPHVTL